MAASRETVTSGCEAVGRLPSPGRLGLGPVPKIQAFVWIRQNGRSRQGDNRILRDATRGIAKNETPNESKIQIPSNESKFQMSINQKDQRFLEFIDSVLFCLY